MTRAEMLSLLKTDDEAALEKLWREADAVRREHLGDAVHLRGLIEISNHCARRCAYCGISACNAGVFRYRMQRDEILVCARLAVEFGYGTVVMQAGEDYGLSREFVADVVRAIKRQTPLAVTLSLGERPDEDLAAWREAGADRYLLRFETSNQQLYKRIHPDLPGKVSDRFAILRRLGELGYEVGSGILIGVPGQTWDDLANDIETFSELDLDMIGVGPYIPHPNTPLGQHPEEYLASPEEQVPSSVLLACKVMAITRLRCPKVNLPSTTAVATLGGGTGREQGLNRGANIIMPNLTPQKYRDLYEIYPAKAGMGESAQETHAKILALLARLGRKPGQGPGWSENYLSRKRMTGVAGQNQPT